MRGWMDSFHAEGAAKRISRRLNSASATGGERDVVSITTLRRQDFSCTAMYDAVRADERYDDITVGKNCSVCV